MMGAKSERSEAGAPRAKGRIARRTDKRMMKVFAKKGSKLRIPDFELREAEDAYEEER